MNRASWITALAFSVCAGHGIAQATSAPTQVKTVQDLVAKIQDREKAAKSVVLEMTTRGSFPGAGTVETEGSLRVLDSTHFHTSMKTRFGDRMEAESEVVKTPDGVLMRESDPAQGEVFLQMTKETLQKLESASAALGRESVIPGVGGQQAGPLGSAMIVDLDKEFELEIAAPKLVDGQRSWMLSGARRRGAPSESDAFVAADRVELLVRCVDLAVVRMTQFARGEAIVDVRITNLVIDKALDPASFKLDIPPKAKVIDIEEHPPAKVQIERVLAEAKAKGWNPDGEPESKK